MIRSVLLVAVLAVAAVLAVVLRRRDRRVTAVAGGDVLTPAELVPGEPVTLGAAATFVQFSSPVCSGCRATARVLDDLATTRDGLRRIEIDVTQRLDLAQRLDIMRTPTVLVLDPAGQVISRLSGVPTAEQALAAAGLSMPDGRIAQNPLASRNSPATENSLKTVNRS